MTAGKNHLHLGSPVLLPLPPILLLFGGGVVAVEEEEEEPLEEEENWKSLSLSSDFACSKSTCAAQEEGLFLICVSLSSSVHSSLPPNPRVLSSFFGRLSEMRRNKHARAWGQVSRWALLLLSCWCFLCCLLLLTHEESCFTVRRRERPEREAKTMNDVLLVAAEDITIKYLCLGSPS